MANEPIVLVVLQFQQLLIGQLVDVALPSSWFAVGDLVNAPGVPAGVAGVMTFAGIGKITDVHSPVRTVRKGHAHKPRVRGAHEIGSVLCRVPAALAREAIVVDASPVDIVHEDLVAIFGGPIVPEVNHRAAMSVTAACLVFLRRADSGSNGLGVGKVEMVGDGGDALI